MTAIIGGTGNAIFTPTRDAEGELITVPQAILLSSVTDYSADNKLEVKMHDGRHQYSVAGIATKREFSLSITNNNASAEIMNLVDAEDVTTGHTRIYTDKTAFAIPATPFINVVAPPSSGTFVSDGGVFYGANGLASDGKQLRRVAATPAEGQYTVSSVGSYLYAAADAGRLVKRNYVYRVAAVGSTVTALNREAGATAEYSLVLATGVYLGVTVTYTFPRVMIKSQNAGAKKDDWQAIKYDLSVMADPVSDIVFTRSFSL
jgi:hypothetical protein